MLIRKQFLLAIFILLIISCSKEKKEAIIEKVEDYSETEIILGDGYWMGMDGTIRYELSNADEFRSQQPFYNYTLKMRNKNSEKLKLDIIFGSIIYTISEYLFEFKIFDESLMINIIDAISGSIEREFYADIIVYHNDVNYGRFIFYYKNDTNEIVMDYYTEGGITTFFYKRFKINYDYSILLINENYDSTKLEKMVHLCNLYEYMIEDKKEKINENILTNLKINHDELKYLTEEFIENKDYINNFLREKIKQLLDFDDEICNIIMRIIIKYITI
jgi:hypothetical protein